MRLTSSVICVFAALILLAVPAMAQDSTPPAPTFNAGFSASFSVEEIGGEKFQALGLLPDFSYGPFGIGLDLSFHFRFYENPTGPFGFYVRSEDFWDNKLTTAQNLDKYVSRIAYFRWGKKGEPLYIQAGLLPSTTLGDGFIVSGYNNGILRPNLRFTGLSLDVDGKLFGFPYVGMESFVNNITTWDLVGLRTYVRPFGLFIADNDFLKNIQFGLTIAADTNPYAQTPDSTLKATTGTGSASVVGIDTVVPLTASEMFSAAAYGDIAFQGSHSGGTIGVGGKLIQVFTWSLENRFLGQNFIPGYFDKGYDLSRAAKYAYYTDKQLGDPIPASVGWKFSLGTNIGDGFFIFNTSLEGPWSSTSNKLVTPKLQSIAAVKEGVLPVNLEAFYIKSDLTSFNKLISAEDALVGAKVGYKLGAVTLSMVYNLRYIPDDQYVSGAHWQASSRLETEVKLY